MLQDLTRIPKSMTASSFQNEIGVLQRKTEWIDIRDFGAVGDGISDNSTALQSALSYAKTNKKDVYIPSGEFAFSQTLNMFNYVGIVGQSRIHSVLKYTGSGVAFNFIDNNNTTGSFGTGCYSNNLKNLTINGTGTANGSTAIKGELRYNVFQDVSIRNFQTIFDVDYNWTNRYVDCLFGTCDVLYKANRQNNAVNFVNCSLDTARVMFLMMSCYAMNFQGGTIEKCSSVILSPLTSGGSSWSNFNFNGVYFENSAPLVDTDVVSGEGTAITSWEIRGFALENSNVNFFVSAKHFIKTRINDVLLGHIKNTIFYKNDDSRLFDAQSAPLVFDNNRYRWFDGGVKRDLTEAFSDWMKQWNTSYHVVRAGSGNAMNFSGKGVFSKGVSGLFAELTPTTQSSNVPNNSFYVSSSDNLLRFKDSTGTVKIVNLT